MTARRILHLSDTHVTASGHDADGVPALAALEGLLHDCRRLDELDLVLVTGDIADDGSEAGYHLVRDRVAAFAAGRGLPCAYTTGNHDRRAEFAAVLGSGHVAADGSDAGRLLDPGGSRAAVSLAGGLRVVTLDSLVPGHAHGQLGDRQLRALGELLADPAPEGTVLALHHPPVSDRTRPWMESMGLRDAQALAATIEGTDVLAILCGHFHLPMIGHLAGVPVSVTPGVVTRGDLTTHGHLFRAVTGAGASIVELGGPCSPMIETVLARDPEAGREVYLVDPFTWQHVADEDA